MQQLERVTNLLALLLTTRRHLTFEEIRQELKGQYPENLAAARAAFERDKGVLRDEGVPIESEILGGDKAGSTGYRIVRSAYELPDLGLTAEETSALRVAVATLRMGQDWGDEALWKLEWEGVGSQPGVPAVSTSLPVDARLPAVHEAISRQNPVSFSYSGRDREVEPYGLLARHGLWYLVGRDVDLDSERTFRLDRINGNVSVTTSRTFVRPRDFDVRSSFPADPKALAGGVDIGSSTAKVRVASSDVGVVRAQYGESAQVEQRRDGSVVFDIPCANVDAFVHWLFGFLERAEVLEPVALREHVISLLTSMTVQGGS